MRAPYKNEPANVTQNTYAATDSATAYKAELDSAPNSRIIALKEISSDVIKLDFRMGSFFLRLIYLSNTNPERLLPDTELSCEELNDIMNAAFAYAAERDAVQYLSRAEHSTFLLSRKLSRKNHSPSSIEKACNYLVTRGYLSDERYAEAFLRNRAINRTEGKTRLLAELASRGIAKEIAQHAVAEFFEGKDELTVLECAIQKLVRKGKTGERLTKALLRLGFSWSDIQKALAEAAHDFDAATNSDASTE